MFTLECKTTEYWKKKFGYTCCVCAPHDVDDKRNVVWKYRNAILGPRYIPLTTRNPEGTLFGKFNNYQIIGRAIIRTWRKDIECVPYRQILHCSGAASESYPEYNVTSELKRDEEYGLSVFVRGYMMVNNIKIAIRCNQTKSQWSVSWNTIIFSRLLTFADEPEECEISVTSFFGVDRWELAINRKDVVVENRWEKVCDSLKTLYPKFCPEVTKFYHDLTFLLVEQPRLASFLTVYEDHFRSRASIPKVDFWKDDFLYV